MQLQYLAADRLCESLEKVGLVGIYYRASMIARGVRIRLHPRITLEPMRKQSR
jgi:hypothetical protein